MTKTTRSYQVEPTLSVQLDAGHGGNDPGCVWEDAKTKEFTFEKDINMAVVEKVIDFLPKHIRVHTTRRADKSVSLHQRACPPYHYDLMVSIHCNSIEKAKQGTVSGMEVIVHSTQDQFIVSVAKSFLAGVSRASGIKPNNPNPIRQNSAIRILALAEKIKDRSGRSTSCLRTAPFSAKKGEKGAGTPAVLLELGYLTSGKDRKLLLDEAKQTAIAKAIAGVIVMLAPLPGGA